MAVTLRHIAEQAGLSVSAVSQILNRRQCNFCNEERKQEVIELAGKLGYRQKFADKIKRGDTTRTVAILKRTHHTSEIDQLVIRMLNLFEAEDCSCYVVSLPKNSDVTERAQDLIDRGVERFVLFGPVWCDDEESNCREFQELIKLLVSHSCTYVSYATPSERMVLQDFAPAVVKTVEFFRKKIGDEFKMLIPLQGSNRESALCSCFPELSVEEVRRKYIFPLEQSELSLFSSLDDIVRYGYKVTNMLLDAEPRVKGLYYMSDQLALGGICCLKERGIEPGKDILLAGFNNFPAVRYCGYPVSTAAHDLAALAEALVAESGLTLPCRREIPPEIIIREENISLK